jgi:hypothetical protein
VRIKVIAPLYITFGFLQKLFLTPSVTTLHLTVPNPTRSYGHLSHLSFLLSYDLTNHVRAVS